MFKNTVCDQLVRAFDITEGGDYLEYVGFFR